MSAFDKVSGPPAVKFKNLGDSVAGRIVGIEDYQETVYNSNPPELKFYPKSGDPVMGVRITLETRPGDATSRQTLWCQGKNLMNSVAAAFRAAGRMDVTLGDDMAVTWIGLDGRAKTYDTQYAANDAEKAAA